MEHTTAHRRDGPVDDVVERAALFGLSAEELEIADGEAVEPHEAVFLDTAQMLYMPRLEVLGHVEIHEYTSCGRHSGGHGLESEALQRGDTPEFLESFARRSIHQHPVFEFEGEKLGAEEVLHVVFSSAQVQHLFGREVGQQLVDIVAVALSGHELTGRDVQEGYADDMFVEMEAGNPVVLLLGEGSV